MRIFFSFSQFLRIVIIECIKNLKSLIPQSWDEQTFSVKGQVVETLKLPWPYNLCHTHSTLLWRSSHRQYCSKLTLSTKTRSGYIWPTGMLTLH